MSLPNGQFNLCRAGESAFILRAGPGAGAMANGSTTGEDVGICSPGGHRIRWSPKTRVGRVEPDRRVVREAG